jgi:glucose/mannose transport system substrate-binding protein
LETLAVDGSVVDDVDVFTWWTVGAEALGLEAIQSVLNAAYPNVKFINGGSAGGGGTSRVDIEARFSANDPPDSFQVHAGQEARIYIEAGLAKDLTELYRELGLETAIPQALYELLAVDGRVYSIPSNVHRANVLWASVPALEAAGIDPSATRYGDVDAFLADLAKIEASDTGLVPLAIGDEWTQVHLLETILIAELGPDGYAGLFSGSTSWDDPKTGVALRKFGEVMGFTNQDSAGLDWQDAAQMMVDGDAVFTVMGDWVPALLEANSMIEGVDYVWAPSPGTEGVFDFVADSFALAEGAPHSEGAAAWLRVIGSAEGQTVLNRAKGSIPARTDVDLADFSAYQKAAAQSFTQDAIVGSLQHGVTATTAQADAVAEAVSRFAEAGAAGLDAFQQELAAAFAD